MIQMKDDIKNWVVRWFISDQTDKTSQELYKDKIEFIEQVPESFANILQDSQAVIVFADGVFNQ